jgi:hypothetical protein
VLGILKHPHKIDNVTQVMQLAETMGERGAWSSELVIWLCRAYIEVSLSRDALGEKLLKEMEEDATN